MDKISSELSVNGSVPSAMTQTEKRALSDVMHSTKRSGGNYGSLAKSQLQPTFYICHKVESDDTIQRLALKYSINVCLFILFFLLSKYKNKTIRYFFKLQEIKRANKLWSDTELNLLENVYIPVNSSQLSTLRTLYPTLNIVQNPSPTMNRIRKSLPNGISNGESTSSISTSDSTTSMLTTTTTNSASFQDYFSKIDQQIRTSKNSLQSFNVPTQYTTVKENTVLNYS